LRKNSDKNCSCPAGVDPDDWFESGNIKGFTNTSNETQILDKFFPGSHQAKSTEERGAFLQPMSGKK
ncbi:MAG TPA: hypothetical protein VHH73_13225, partial [Verrucomicrobiae bacterium]|nr:hypothetical protein [Verrucomicrobiae bacterium]